MSVPKSQDRAVIELTPDQNNALEAVAKSLGLSRNRYILMRALEAEKVDRVQVAK